MTARYTLITHPTTEPVDISDLKSQARMTSGTSEDGFLDVYLKSSRQYVENLIGPIVSQVWDMTLDQFPAGNTITIEKPRVSAVSSLKYTDEDGVESTFSSSYYVTDFSDVYGKIVLKSDCTWPTDTLKESGAIKIRFTAGFSAVPDSIKHAILLLASHFDANRIPVQNTRDQAVEVPFAVSALIGQYRDYHV